MTSFWWFGDFIVDFELFDFEQVNVTWVQFQLI